MEVAGQLMPSWGGWCNTDGLRQYVLLYFAKSSYAERASATFIGAQQAKVRGIAQPINAFYCGSAFSPASQPTQKSLRK